MQDLVLLLSAVLFLAAGLLSPFAMTLGYVWVDIFTPQQVSNGILASIPLSLIFGVLAVMTYIVRDRRDPPRINLVLCLQVALCIWVTLTLQWAVAPAAAEVHWNVVIKVCLFATFIPYVIRSRVQIEALVLVYLFSIFGQLLPWGIKTFITGGGYDKALGLLGVNTALLAESSTVSAVGVMVVPFLLYMRKHSILLPRNRFTDLGAIALIVIGLVASIGTFARTALVAFAVGGAGMLLASRRKAVFILIAVVMGGIMFSVTSDRWTARISTTADYQTEGSALTRMLVWRWAWDFAQSHPFGGGFRAYTTSRIETPAVDGGPPIVQFGRAYHNIFFGVLGDQGYPGLVLYLGMLAATFMALRKAKRLTRNLPEHAWCADLAQATQIGLLTMLAAGNFVEIGWTPLIWYLISFAVCLQQYARRVTSQAIVAAKSHASIGTMVASPAMVAGRPIPNMRMAGQGSPGSWQATLPNNRG